MSIEWQLPVAERGTDACLNAADLNRIEQNITYLAQTLSDAGYRVTRYPSKTWDETMIPTQADFTRLCNAIAAITTAYHDWRRVNIQSFATAPLTATIVNAVEQKLYDVKALLDQTEGYETNTHATLSTYTYSQLSAYTYDQLKKEQLTK